MKWSYDSAKKWNSKVDFQWEKPFKQIVEEASGGDKTKLFMANEAKRLMTPYVPAKNLALSKAVSIYVENGQGIVHYLSPYARFQFEGMVMIGTESHNPWARYGEHKVVTSQNLDYSTFRHPLATSHWDKAMMAARKEDIARAVQNYIRKKG